MKKLFLSGLVILTVHISFAQLTKEIFYKSLFGKDSLVDYVLLNKEKFRLQFVVTDIQRDTLGLPSFTTFDFSTDSYFYPASLVKLPTAIATLEIMDSLLIPLDAYIKMQSDVECGNNDFAQATQNRNIQLGLAMENLISISDNKNYSLFFHFVGPKELNNKLKRKGLSKTHIYSSFSGCPKGVEIKTNSFSIFNSLGVLLYKKPVTFLESTSYINNLTYSSNKLIGRQQIKDGKIINKAYDFNYNLDYSLNDIHKALFKLVFPKHFESEQSFSISEKSRLFILNLLAKYPREMQDKSYHNLKLYPDNFYKYSIIGNNNSLASSGQYRIFSKIGISYGFVTETAYIVDFKKKKDYIFSISMYVNQDEIINDGVYEYEKIARPFIANLSRIIQDNLSHSSNKITPYTDAYFNEIKVIIEP